MSRLWVLFVVAVASALAVSERAYAPASTRPATIAQWRGDVNGVGQDTGSIVWCDYSHISIRELAPFSTRRIAASCDMAAEIAVAGDDVAWHGYADYRTSHTEWSLAALTAGRVHRIGGAKDQFSPGIGDDVSGLVSDGTSLFYARLRSVVREAPDCAQDAPLMTFRLVSGGVYRITAIGGIAVRGFPPAVQIAASDGRIAVVEPAKTGSWCGDGSKGLDFPRAATNAAVEVRRSQDGALVARFRPTGIVRALALSQQYAVALVENRAGFWIEWYEAASGERRGAAKVASSVWRISASGERVVFSAGKVIRIVDLSDGSQRDLWRVSAGAPIGLSINGNRAVWGEQDGRTARVLALTLAGP